MIESLLDACRYILEDHREGQSSYWLASQIMEMKLWRASESSVRKALNKDIEKSGELSPFVRVGEDEFALRSWTAR
ncbi:HTH domain-containing protein [Singulisphaera sp. Ch08]|uniref:HTH domain-containing protein n=1 Tax=Singulisphaera sp. Ch08 TaxID=3120278 RepID=UPI00387351AC